MTKSFQKSANNLHELQLPHPGIINFEDFNKHFELHCYEPAPDLRPFVVHIWTQRQLGNTTRKPIEVLSGPNIYLFFTQETAFIHGITTHEFNYNPLIAGVIAGVKFRPGGFYPFLQQPISKLSDALPLEAVFPDADEIFREKLLSQPDKTIVTMLETLLRSKRPKSNKNLEQITMALNALDTDSSLRTVRAVAKALSISERSLQLLFQTHVGVGLKWIITRKRLLDAISQAQGHSHPSWVNIATELGYSSQSHFSSEFKEIIGQSPSQYLKNL